MTTKRKKICGVDSITSDLPGWFDPTAPGFTPPENWEGAHVRISIPVGADAAHDLEEARKRLARKYPGAELILVPEIRDTSPSADVIDSTGTDEELLERYFSHVTPPDHVTAGQLTAYLKRLLPSISVFGIQGIRFESVEAENVLCFEHVHWDLSCTGLTLVTGVNKDWDGRSNGSGKSSLTNLPFLALFGRTFKNQTHDAWACDTNELTAKIVLKLKLPDNRTLEIRRQRRPGLLQVFLDGADVTMGKPDHTQQLIERLTNLTWDILVNAVYIGQREIGSVFGTDKERKELFSRLLGLDRFLDVGEKLRKVALRIQREADLIENAVSACTVAMSEACIGAVEIRSALKEAPVVTDDSISRLYRDMENIRKEIVRIENLEILQGKALDNLMREGARYAAEFYAAETRTDEYRKHLEASRRVEGTCFQCGSVISPSKLAQHQKSLERTIRREQEDADKHKILLTKARSAESVIRETIEKHRRTAQKHRNDILTKEQEILKLNDQKDARRRLVSIFNDKRARVRKHKQALQLHKRALTATLEEKEFIDICISAVGRNGLPAYLCAVAAPRLNTTVTHYSSLFSESEINVQFQMTGGDIDVDVLNLHGGRTFKDQSAGESCMAGIITAFAFREILVPLNLLICDEPSEGLDVPNAVMFAAGLTSVVKRFQHVVVISHNTNLLGALEYDRHIEVVKSNRISAASIISR